MSTPWLIQNRSFALLFGACLFAVLSGCGRQPKPTAVAVAHPRTPGGPVRVKPIDLPQAELRPGTAVVLLVDTSGSMKQEVNDKDGRRRTKHQLARQAIERIIDKTAAWTKAHPDRPIQFGLLTFSSSVKEVLPIGPFDKEKAVAALDRIPPPNSGTAIGEALARGYQALYGSGCVRKYLICVTDGENTAGMPPDAVARRLHEQTGDAVQLHFVAFDTSARQFDFLKEVNGHVVEASDGGQLEKELTEVYDKKILVEAEEPDVK